MTDTDELVDWQARAERAEKALLELWNERVDPCDGSEPSKDEDEPCAECELEETCRIVAEARKRQSEKGSDT